MEVSGNCCVKIHSKSSYRGNNEILTAGFNGVPNLTTVRSFKIDDCHNFESWDFLAE